MPSIDVAMTTSLRGGVSGILARSLQHAFQQRSIITDAQDQIVDIKTAFSSWDNCMQVVYCKYGYPVSSPSYCGCADTTNQMARHRLNYNSRPNALFDNLVYS